MKSASEIFESRNSSLYKTFEHISRSERAELIQVFHERVLNKQGKQYPLAFIASKLSMYTIQDLHYFLSDCKLNWKDNLGQYFWSLFIKNNK